MPRALRNADRRRYPRVDETLRLKVRRGGEHVATETVNVSCGGALCWLDHRLRPMTKVAVALALPKRLVECTGVVIRCDLVKHGTGRHHPRYRVALFFLDLAREDHRAIAEFVLASMLTSPRGHRRP